MKLPDDPLVTLRIEFPVVPKTPSIKLHDSNHTSHRPKQSLDVHFMYDFTLYLTIHPSALCC